MITFGGVPPGAYITSVTGTTAVMSAGATNGLPRGDTVIVKPLYEIVPFRPKTRLSPQ
jgi:hypothetical protein